METQPVRRRLTGTVVSDAMAKTAVVEISRRIWHAKYRKQYLSTTRLKAHNEDNAYRVGDVVVIEETRPLSKEKRWRIIEKIRSAERTLESASWRTE
ncbi:MAG: 30S ribosomal protein S17 [Candidatus Liptonbacteria bacterium]|nr:30S ribosomal protein S17 [Candidatus Liptonbacteria bacterium]